MNQALPSKLTPALIAGVGFGFASGIPIVNLANCACCALAVGGGLGAAFLWLRNAGPVPQPPYGDGMLLGLLTGVVGAVVATIVSIPFQFMGASEAFGGFEQMQEMMGDQDIPPAVQNLMESIGSGGFTMVGMLIGAVVAVVVYPIFAALGALIGTALFHKKATTAVV